jgi:hypothetical protein
VAIFFTRLALIGNFMPILVYLRATDADLNASIRFTRGAALSPSSSDGHGIPPS